MFNFKISKSDAKRLQKWALEISGAKKFLDSIPTLPKTIKIKPGLYVSYDLDESEFDDYLDWPTPAVATVLAVDKKGNEAWLGILRAYNWETYWLETPEDEQVDTTENWWKIILNDYEKIKKEEIKD